MYENKCEECGGSMVESGGYNTCTGCGLSTGTVWETDNNPYLNNGESSYHKEHRQTSMMKKERKKQVAQTYGRVRIWREVYLELKEHCTENGLIISDFVSKIITARLGIVREKNL